VAPRHHRIDEDDAPTDATYSTPLDRAGNSVRGQFAVHYLLRQLGLDLFVSAQPT
jgi:hypothetical protein